MKKFLSILVMMTMVLTLAIGSATLVYADNSHGADAHSPSMSRGTGDKPIEDDSTTLDGGGEIDNEVVADDEENIEENTESENEIVATLVDKIFGNKIMMIIVCSVLSLLVIVIIVIASVGKRSSNYKKKH